MKHNQFWLLRQRRFLPFFVTQFLGAFNDNVFRVALATWLVYDIYAGERATASVWINVAQALFILPFFLLSATAGQMADKWDKDRMIRAVKLAEVAIMLAAAAAFWGQRPLPLVALLFLMGAQSAFFGPVKYAILPQHLTDDELLGGNALVETGTFLAILSGTMLGGYLVAVGHGTLWVGVTLVAVALLGYLAARMVPRAPAADPNVRVNWNFVTETLRVIGHARKNPVVFRSILAISWFWFFGSVILTQMPNFARNQLHGDNTVFTILLAVFSVGIAVGSLLCERLSGRRVEIGLVPLGAAGLSYFTLQLAWVIPEADAGSQALVSAGTFMTSAVGWPVLASMLGIGVFGGWFIVPLYALVQQRSEESHRSRIIAANNILNAAFMVIAAAFAIALFQMGGDLVDLLLAVALLNALVATYIFVKVPEFVLRFLTWLLLHTMYRVRHRGLENIPAEGPALLVANHVSFVDALIIAGYASRPVRFVMDHRIFRTPVLGWLFRVARAIPIASAREDAQLKAQAFDAMEAALAEGELVMIFPEGQITMDGQMNPFKRGVEEILRRRPVPVIPMALRGLWGSYFSRHKGRAMAGFPTSWMRRIELVAGSPVSPEKATAAHLEARVRELLDSQAPDSGQKSSSAC
jgi:hypothetical protein